MASDPLNEQMDRLLRHHAKRRREQADGFTLHPATRRLLHAEVLRQFRLPQSAESSWVVWLRGWRAAGLAFSILAIAAFVIWLALPRAETRRGEIQMAKADVASPPAVNAPEPRSDKAERAPRPVTVAATRQLRDADVTKRSAGLAGETDRNGAPAATDTVKQFAAATPARSMAPVGEVRGELKDSVALKSLDAVGAGSQNTPMPAESVTQSREVGTKLSLAKRAGEAESTLAAAKPYFVQPSVASSGPLFVRATEAQDRDYVAQPVLQQFHMEQTATGLRIVDADGSVYEGEIPAGLRGSAAVGGRLSEDLLARRSGGAASNATAFVLTGTNKQSGELVVVSGTFGSVTDQLQTNGAPMLRTRAIQIVPSSPAIPSTQPQAASKGKAEQPTPVGVSNATLIEGTLRVGSSPERAYRAVRVQR